jgi:hypothetical protein
MPKSDMDDNVGSGAGLSGTASAFQSGFNRKPKAPKQPKGKKNAGGDATPTTTSPLIPGMNIPVFKHGGRVKKTGLVLAHRGEVIVPAKRARRKVSGHKRTVVKA